MSASARRNDLVRRARRFGVRTVRRYGLLPAGMADKNGEDDALLGTRLDQTVMVYFPDTRDALYQLREWYAPLRALNERHPVVYVMQDSRTARIVRAESGLPTITVARYATLDDLLARSDVKLALYVNHTPQNFSGLRFISLMHVYLGHGESDKGVSVSNQQKAYDFCFVAGQAAIDRAQSHLMRFNAAARCVPIGRPQLDFDRSPARPARTADSRPTVLYAPTWEGAQPSVAYGSVASHGPRLVRALLDSGRYAVAYRPHPLSGVISTEFGEADAEVRRLVTEAAAADPLAGHRVDTGVPLETSFDAADLLVCDVSAVTMGWVPSGKPLVVTEPLSADVATARTPLLDVVPRLAAADAGDVVALVDSELGENPGKDARLALVEHYLGDTTPGAATARFLDACTHVIELRDQLWAPIAENGAGGV